MKVIQLWRFVYRTTPEEGGETVFPAAPPEMRVSGAEWSPCARQGLAVKPRRGDALLFYRHAARWLGCCCRVAAADVRCSAGDTNDLVPNEGLWRQLIGRPTIKLQRSLDALGKTLLADE